VRDVRSHRFRGDPCRRRHKTSSSQIHLTHAVIRVHRPEGDKSVSGSGLAQQFCRGGNSLLSYAANPFYNVESRAENDFSVPVNGFCESRVGSGIWGRCVEDDVIKDESRFLLRQTIQQANVQRAVPDIVERLVQLLGRILVKVNEHNVMGVERGSPEEGQIVAQSHQRLCE